MYKKFKKRIQSFSIFLTLILLLSGASCVKKSVYKTELLTRQLAEAREKVLLTELLDRKTEAAKMIKSVGDFNRTIGKQESDIAELRSRIVQLSTNANQASSSLLEEKGALEKKLRDKTALLDTSEAKLSRLNTILRERKTILEALSSTLSQSFNTYEGVQANILADQVVLTLPDKLLFETSGVNISSSGRVLLDSLSKILTTRPDLETQIITYTDNQLPKGNKSLVDTWDWSLRRATTISRTLISDFGVNANQLSPTGRGEFFPLAGNDTPEGRQQNRRTELLFKPKMKVIE